MDILTITFISAEALHLNFRKNIKVLMLFHLVLASWVTFLWVKKKKKISLCTFTILFFIFNIFLLGRGWGLNHNTILCLAKEKPNSNSSAIALQCSFNIHRLDFITYNINDSNGWRHSYQEHVKKKTCSLIGRVR